MKEKKERTHNQSASKQATNGPNQTTDPPSRPTPSNLISPPGLSPGLPHLGHRCLQYPRQRHLDHPLLGRQTVLTHARLQGPLIVDSRGHKPVQEALPEPL
mmetsp:Transcript_31281/g.77501  ORF Transcript_31281/g.77501 Transcript_31281/m.77501 type:complete len:101 (-) Transcript_31281:903-1205(-)